MIDEMTEVDPVQIQFNDDGMFPNSKLPLLLYRGAIDPETKHLAATFEQRLAANHWSNSWCDGVYNYAHYHSTSHEALAVFKGGATLQLGGPKKGSYIEVTAGDLIVIPAGVAHQRIETTNDFGVVGAYPEGRKWDVLRGNRNERPEADRQISEVPLPTADPLYGPKGPLIRLWNLLEKS